MTGAVGSVCEVCAAPISKSDDLLCPDCSYAFTQMLEVIHGHPDIDIKDFERIRQVFEWRIRKMGLTASQPEVIKEERALSSALSRPRDKQTVDAR